MCRGIVRFDGAQQYSRTPALLLHDDLQHICPKPQPPAGLAIVAAFHEAAEEPVRPRLPWKAAEEPVRSEPVRPRMPWKGAEEPVLPVRSGPDRPKMPWKGAEEPVRRPRLPIPSLVLEPHDDDDDDEIEDLQPHDDDDDDDEIKHLQPQLTTHQTNNASNQQQQQQKITRDYPTYALSSKSRSSRKGAKKSIFSTGALSPPGYNSLGRPLPSPDFLATCFSCRCSLRPGEDIYMYRGDRAFCSTECRYKQIVADESPSCTLLPVDQRCPQSSSSINWLGFTPTAAAATINVLG